MMGRFARWLTRLVGGKPDIDRDDAGHWARVQEVLAEALALPAAERAALLGRLDDRRLRDEVASLIAAHESEGAVDRFAVDATAPDASEIHPGITIGHYEIHGQLGVGGMGVVFRALDRRLRRPVALKFLPRSLGVDGPAKRRFLLEARAAASLEHNNICTIHEIAESPAGRLFISMPCYEGETIKDALARGPLALADALDVALQTARGLARAHQSGIVHRDIKPANLMRTRDGTIKILDFGLAKVADVQLTSGGMIMGTVPYMSPEQAGGGRVDQRTDLWSLGVVLYEMVSGRRPFEGGHFEAVLAAVMTDEPPPPAPSAGTGTLVNQIVESLLQKSLSHRCTSAGELVSQLEEALAAERGDGGETPMDRGAAGGGYESVPPEGERRQATVVVTRVTNYSTLIEDTAPDDLNAALNRLWEIAQEIVTRHGGMVNRLGDEEMVSLFGIPIAHEDDYLRATRAAIELHDRVPIDHDTSARVTIGVRTGISSGVVAVQRAPEHQEGYKIAGDPLALATQLAASAPARAVVLSPESRRLVAPYVETEAVGQIAGPNGEPLIPYQVLRLTETTTRLEAAARTGLTAFCGRDAEAATIAQAMARAAEGTGQFVTVVGEAGVGKSRLLYEFAHSQIDGGAKVLRGRCLPANTLPYQPFVESLRETLDMGSISNGPATTDEVVARIQGISRELTDFIPLYLHVLSIDSEDFPLPRHYRGAHFRPAMREAFSALLTLQSRKRLTVLLFEDWHWADNASHEALNHLVEASTDARLLIVTTYRPGHRVTWHEQIPHTSIHLGPLQRDGSERMIRSIFGVDELDPDITAVLHDRAGGNPFFLEELCLTLREQGLVQVEDGTVVIGGSLDELHLPGTVQGVIRTRLDRLDSDAREIIRLAAVVGRDFSLSILTRARSAPSTLDRSLERLKELGIIQRTRVVPDPTFRFKHALTQEVAYDTLLQHQRRTLHARVGAAIEDAYPDRATDVAERLAHHFSRAEDWNKAVRYGIAGAEKARSLSEFANALDTLDEVEEWTLKVRDGEERRSVLIDLLLRQESLCETLGYRQRQQEILARLLILLEPDRDRSLVGEVYRRQGDLYVLRHQFDAARQALEQAIQISRELEDVQAERNAIVSFGLACWHESKPGDALPHMERALAMDRARGDLDATLTDLMNMGQILRNMGAFDQAQETLNAAAELTKQFDVDIGKRVYLLQITALLYRARGNYDRALEILEETQEIVEANHLPIQLCYQLTTKAAILYQMGRIEESLDLYRRTVDVARRARHGEGAAQSSRITGETLDSLGRHDDALPYLMEAARLFVQIEDRESEALMQSRIALIHERARRFEEAEQAWHTARDIHRRFHNAIHEANALEGLARVARDGRRDLNNARDLLRDALDLTRQAESRRREAELRNVAGNTAWLAGAYAEAMTHYEEAHRLFEDLHETQGMGLTKNSIGVTLVRLGRRDDGRRQLEEAIAYNTEAGERLLQGHGLAALGDVHYDSGDLASAKQCYTESLAIRRQIDDARGEGWMLERLARLAEAHRQFDDAVRMRDDARAIADTIGDIELLNACTATS